MDKVKRRLIKLKLFAVEDIEVYNNKYSCFIEMKKRRVCRLIKEAYEQKTVLTLEDLSVILGTSIGSISKWVREYQKEKGELLPTRGNVADIGPGLTHKKEIVSLHIQGMITPEISRKTNHSREAVDRYISDYERIKVLKERNFTAEEISNISQRGLSVVNQYLEIIEKSS